MKTFFNLCAVVITVMALAASSHSANAQSHAAGKGSVQLNLGADFVSENSFYGGVDFGVSDFITFGPRFAFAHSKSTIDGVEWKDQIMIPSLRADYHFGNHFKSFPQKLDLYAGTSLGYSVWKLEENSSTLEVEPENNFEYWVQLGVRWYFTEKFGINTEINPGTLNTKGLMDGYLTLGVSVKL